MNKILFIDSVTTGMNTERCAIYKLGGIYVEGNQEKKRFDFHILPFPYARISDSCLWLSGETRSSIANYPEESEAFKDIIEFLNTLVSRKTPTDKLYIAGYNTNGFDSLFLKELFKRQNSRQFFNYFFAQGIDLMSMAAFALMERRSSMPDFQLDSAARFLEVEPTIHEKYSCIDNAETCLKIYNQLKRIFNLSGEDIEFGQDWVETIKNY